MPVQHAGAEQPTRTTGEEKGKSAFLSGLLGGIGLQHGQSNGLPSEATATPALLQLPKLQQMKPLPPLPHVPTIAEFQRTISGPRMTSLASPLEIPRLEVLPLLGTGIRQVLHLQLPKNLLACHGYPSPGTWCSIKQSGVQYVRHHGGGVCFMFTCAM